MVHATSGRTQVGPQGRGDGCGEWDNLGGGGPARGSSEAIHCTRVSRIIENAWILSSMMGVGHCYDNAAAESFFGLPNRDRIHRRCYMPKYTPGEMSLIMLNGPKPAPSAFPFRGSAICCV